MPFRRLVDYTGLTVWIVTLIFLLGTLYAQQHSNTKAIVANLDYQHRVEVIDREIVTLKMQDSYQQKWQSDFMITFKDFVKEMKENNEQVMKKIQTTDNNVLRTSYQLEAMNTELKKSYDSGSDK
jgi:hypothetical protein